MQKELRPSKSVSRRNNDCFQIVDHLLKPKHSISINCKMDVKDMTQKGNMFYAKFDISAYTGLPYTSNTSPDFIINGLISFQVQVTKIKIVSSYVSEYTNLIFVKFNKIIREDTSRYLFKLSSIKFEFTDKTFISDDSTWRLIHEWKTVNTYSFDITVLVETIDTIGSFASLLDDVELADFSLRAEDGSIRFHRAVLAASSPILRRLLGEKWRDTREGCVEVPGITRLTLAHLKNYMYTRVVPSTGLKQLLMLSTYYMMPELEQKCIDGIVSNLNPQNTLMLSEFAVKNKMTRLHLAILDCIQSGAIQVKELRFACYEEQRIPERIDSKRIIPRKCRSRESHTNVRYLRTRPVGQPRL